MMSLFICYILTYLYHCLPIHLILYIMHAYVRVYICCIEQVTGGGQVGGGVVIPPPVSGLRHVSAPETRAPTSPQAALPPGQNVCADCERLIV